LYNSNNNDFSTKFSNRENKSKDNIGFYFKKESIGNESENRDNIKLKNLNTNDTTSLKSCEDSISKSNSFELDYNSVFI